ncbi:MAG: alpha/beta family hydrolase, partial [Planctomycetota bacterium]|nr:alpha/beta family hydrolase [Planctomycetota bacterium]
TPCLILQGERDPMGNREEVQSYSLSEKIEIHWMTDGDHSFKPRKASGWTVEQNWLEAAKHVGRFLLS